ncbi:hypothetical protein PG985_003036 [Apiospora marii]|uniref:LysM domain-containing protein n=1 Tax=Apiospora marii TaxID=335849 RepID=A0ABR1RUG0_9PEZI
MSTVAPQPDIPTPTAACEANSSYTIKKGDTCYAVARAYGLTPADILQANPQMSGSCDLVYIDQVICLPTGPATTAGTTEPSDTSSIPVTHRTASTGDQPTTSTNSTAGESGGNSSSSTSTATDDDDDDDDDDDGCTLRHTVVAGDTCYDTWHKYSLTQETFMALNPHLSIRPDGHCAMSVGDVVCVAGNDGGPWHPKDPSDQFPKKMSVLSVIPVSDNAKNHPTASAESKRWLPVTFQTSRVRETGDE